VQVIGKSIFLGGIATLGMLLGGTAGAQMDHERMQPTQAEFQQIDQPLWVKGAVTMGGLGLIGLELWWFLLSKPKSCKATNQAGIQEVTVTVLENSAERQGDIQQAEANVRLAQQSYDRQQQIALTAINQARTELRDEPTLLSADPQPTEPK
jgi:plastocyanin domain-containing protein